MDKLKENIDFYEEHYDIIEQWFLTPKEKIHLGDRSNRVCRFCRKTQPEVTFNKVAHVIPELLGNKSLFSSYECDTCNEMFGSGIENDLGNWSKPSRTFNLIRGKRGVPTLKKQNSNDKKDGWDIRFDNDNNLLKIESYEDYSIIKIDKEKRW